MTFTRKVGEQGPRKGRERLFPLPNEFPTPRRIPTMLDFGPVCRIVTMI